MKTRVKLSFHLILTLAAMLMMAQTAWADDEAPVYDLVSEVPTVDGGQATNMQSSYDYGSLVDGNTSRSSITPVPSSPRSISSGRVIITPSPTIQQRGLSKRN